MKVWGKNKKKNEPNTQQACVTNGLSVFYDPLPNIKFILFVYLLKLFKNINPNYSSKELVPRWLGTQYIMTHFIITLLRHFTKAY